MIFVHLVNCNQPDVLQTIVVSFFKKSSYFDPLGCYTENISLVQN